METLNITDTRKRLSQIINNELSVEIGISKRKSVILPKREFDELQKRIAGLKKETQKLELELITKESEEILKSNQKRYPIAEVDAMLGKVWKKHEGNISS